MGDDDRDDVLVEERLAGRSVLAIAKRHRCSSSEVEAVVDRRLDFKLDNNNRLRAIKLDVTRLEALMLPFFERATKERDVAAGTLVVKILERRALLLGLDSPVRIDVTQVEAQEAPTRHEKIRDALMSLKYGPNGRNSDADAVDALSDSNGSGQKH